MKCFHGDDPARGVYSFCGRALYKGHVKKMPAILSIAVGEAHMSWAVAVANALNCWVCKPQPEPIEKRELC